jgi:hypothetical protein
MNFFVAKSDKNGSFEIFFLLTIKGHTSNGVALYREPSHVLSPE